MPGEKLLSVGRYDMAFIHSPGGKHLLVFLLQVLAVSGIVVFRSGWAVLSTCYANMFANPYFYVALALVIAVQVWHRSIKRALVVTDQRLLVAYRLPFARAPRVETYVLRDVVKSKISHFCGIQESRILLKVGRKRVFVDCSELSNAEQIIQLVRNSSSSPSLIEKKEKDF
ncbi:MAG: hypothetical protein SFV17_25975 [Candidatus Obscuribacter sp.]|nr:hypothetical protein [Candidatus Obscuribacter sp.]